MLVKLRKASWCSLLKRQKQQFQETIKY